MDEKEGEVERKVRELQEEVFEKYNPGGEKKNDKGEPFITKENLQEFIEDIMKSSGEYEAFNQEDFDKGYNEFDSDASGQIEKQEFTGFIKRFADL